MKKFKWIFWLIIIALAALLYFQNRAFFEAKNTLMINLYMTDEYHSPELYNAIWFLGAIVIGFLISYFFALIDKFRNGKMMKLMRARIQEQEDEIDQLKRELNMRSGGFSEKTAVGGSGAPTSSIDIDSTLP